MGKRKCVSFGQFMSLSNLNKVGRGTTIEGSLSCKRKRRDLVYLGEAGGLRGGCKFGWLYSYKGNDGKIRTGCANRNRDPLIRVTYPCNGNQGP